MVTPVLQTLNVGAGAAQRRIACLTEAGRGEHPLGLMWLSGFKSEMTSTKPTFLAEVARQEGLAMTRFDYSGHGQSGGCFEDGTIGAWLEEALAVFLALTRGGQIVVGSSMGGYLALLLLRKLLEDLPAQAARVRGLVLIAPAWDMTELLMWQRFQSSIKEEIERTGRYERPSRYGDGPYVITRRLIEEGRRHLIAERPFDPGCPVHIIHGLLDPDVPWEHSLELESVLRGDRVRITAVPDGEHRLSRPEDLELLRGIVMALASAGARDTLAV